jgi:multiple sugar transport system ATP-binding protein
LAEVSLEHIQKIYPNGFHAVCDAEFVVEDREFVVLVGPSGCGKTTLLRMVAGLESITEGTMRIGGEVVNDLPPRERDIAMVFQNYALYPHMNVFENMAMGLKIRKTPASEVRLRVEEAADLLGVTSLLERRPAQLSGGQRQRVALGRAIVRRPRVFLFDEPLSNLDAKMRVEMRTEISRLHRRLDATMIYVTHDQTEAMTMGDRIVVMNEGTIQQVASPLDLYNRPGNRFVAGFVGSPAMNFWPVSWLKGDRLQLGPHAAHVAGGLPVAMQEYRGRDLLLGVRPEDLHVGDCDEPNARCARFDVHVDVTEPLGSETLLYWREEAGAAVARVAPSTSVEPGGATTLLANLSHSHLFDRQTGEALLSWPGRG